MADKDTGQKSLEMRVAELEDKLAQLHISEDEMKTYQKVASKLGAGAAPCTSSPCVAAGQQPCVAAQQQVAQPPCVASQSISPIYYRCYYYNHCYYYRCYYYNDCILAGGGPSGGGVPGGGGFGGFGT